jgi:osmoprotectant transport system ATP-binding protein
VTDGVPEIDLVHRASFGRATYTLARVIRLRDVVKRYPGGQVAVDHLNLDVDEGEICVLVGPSGCGKTTTLRMINRLIEPTSGTIEVAGDNVMAIDAVELRRRIGYVIQQIGLFPHLTVGANVATVPKLLGWKKARINARVDELLATVGLDPAHYKDRYPSQLSGGQQQRVGVARALAADPPVLLMDEPFGAIDPVTRGRLQQEFLRLHEQVRKTVVLVTHDIDEAVLLGDRIALLAQGGHLAQHGTPDDLLTRPQSEFVASFVGQDRGLKRLSVTPIPDDIVRPLPSDHWANGSRHPIVSRDASLRDALAQALLSNDGDVVLVENGGKAVGIVGLDDLMLVARPEPAAAAETVSEPE